jgi:hypothetical protein
MGKGKELRVKGKGLDGIDNISTHPDASMD